jgi:2-oxoacid:acceptor oxidoreductase delta subunit (pyruvate/2-ketoisovalerate family)
LEVARRITTFEEVVGGSTSRPRYSRRAAACPAATAFGCDNCYGVCPENAVIKLGDGQYEFDYDYCKGCGICVAECPCGSIAMQPEQT